jgi:hypothetical protein
METDVKRDTLRVLLAGHGAFGAVHAQAWAVLGFAESEQAATFAPPSPREAVVTERACECRRWRRLE